ncbi:MAG: MBL fold metallo-hydrolase [Myxococcota bacterium]|jgi:7,8-dihydropterin-6-yl-methyl-4-(beta-D-ribofuranosyl)aminobenzene 5'-phosphate synthase|nr:MBL fold metallo-hydrolase [Myxococcota bacterium]
MRVTVLVENTSGPLTAVAPEFGLSLLVEAKAATVLLDTGSSGLFARNANALGIDLAAVDWLVLSHGHFDHGGGLAAFFEQNKHAPVIMRRGAERPFYGSALPGLPNVLHRAGLVTRYIGLNAEVLRRYAERIRWIDANTELCPSVTALTAIPHIHCLPAGNRHLLAECDGRFLPDDLSHELVLVMEHDAGAVVFTGCAHNGVLNMLEAALLPKPGRPISSVVGGFHLGVPRSAPTPEVQTVGRALRQRVTGTVYTGHCTGARAVGVLQAELGPRLKALHTGMQFEL